MENKKMIARVLAGMAVLLIVVGLLAAWGKMTLEKPMLTLPMYVPALWATAALVALTAVVLLLGNTKSATTVVQTQDKAEAEATAYDDAPLKEKEAMLAIEKYATAKQKEGWSPAEATLWAICEQLQLCQAVVYEHRGDWLMPTASYAFFNPETDAPTEVAYGEGLTGQAAKTGNPLYLTDVPAGYMTVVSGLGQANPNFLLIQPYKSENTTLVAEFASFNPLEGLTRRVLEQALNRYNKVFNKN